MASTFSSLLRIELIGTGDQSGTWGNTTNTNLGTLIEQAIAGTATVDVSVGNVTLTSVNGSSDQSRCAAIRVIGTPGTARNIIAPALSHIYVIANGSDGVVTIKTSTSTGVAVPVGEVYLVYYDPNVAVADFRLVGRAARSTNTANTLVLRDGSGNFAAGTITANDFVGDLTGDVAGSLNGPVGNLVPNTGAFTDLSSTGNTTIGNAAGDTLTVNATPTFNVTIPVTSGGTGVTTATGSGSVVRATSPTLVTPILGTPTSGTLTNCTGLSLTTGVTGTLPVANGGTGVTTSTGSGSNVLSTSPSLVTPILGTPTSGTLTNCTGLPLTTGVTGTLPIANGGTNATTAAGARTSLGSTTVGDSFFTLTNPSAITFPQINANNTVSALSAASYRTATGATTLGSNLYTITNPNAVTFLRVNLDNSVSALDAAAFRTAIGATTVGGNFFTLTNPSAIRFVQINADNTVSALDAASFRTAIGAGSGGGTVTSVAGTGGYGGLTLSGTVTASGNITLGGTPTGTWPISVSGSAASATTATNLAGGGAGQVPYNTAAGTTAFLAAGTSGQIFQSTGTTAPTWVNQSSLSVGSASTAISSTLATNVAGGGAGRVVFNTGNNATSFTAQGSNGQLLQSAGTGTPTWVDQSTIAAGTATTATNIAGGGAGRVPYNTGAGATAFVAVGSAGQALISNGTSAPTFGSAITLGNSLASPSVTPTGVSTVTFIGIPSWVNRVTVMLSGISPSTNGSFSMQLGTSSGFVTSGYTGGGGTLQNGNLVDMSNASTAIVAIGTSDTNTAVTGTTTLTRVNGNTWVGSSSYYRLSDLRTVVYNATITLPASLDRLQLFHSAGNFDAGTINIMYE